MKTRYHNYFWRAEGYDLQYSKLYNDLKSGIAIESEAMAWNKTISSNAVKRFQKLLNIC